MSFLFLIFFSSTNMSSKVWRNSFKRSVFIILQMSNKLIDIWASLSVSKLYFYFHMWSASCRIKSVTFKTLKYLIKRLICPPKTFSSYLMRYFKCLLHSQTQSSVWFSLSVRIQTWWIMHGISLAVMFTFKNHVLCGGLKPRTHTLFNHSLLFSFLYV